jgi:hypothetical protein
MFRHHRALLALTFAVVALAGVSAALAQEAPAQGKPNVVWTNPVRGLAEIQYIISPPKLEKDMIVTTFQVKNMSTAPIARLTIEEFWYDKARNPVTGDKQFLKKPLAPGEVATIVLRTPKTPGMDAQNLKFSHQNGEIKPKKVTKF